MLADESEVTSSSKFHLLQPSERCSQRGPGEEEGWAQLLLLRSSVCALGPPDATSAMARLSC